MIAAVPPARRVALGILGRRSTEFEVLMQWVHVLRETHWPGPTFSARDLYPAEGRNVITAGALARPASDWQDFLWVDSDHLPSSKFIERIHEYAGHWPVVGGLYFGREWPFELQAWESDPATEGLKQIPPARVEAMLEHPRLHPVAGVGTGWMLITRSCLEAVAKDKGGPGKVWEVKGLSAELEAELGTGLVLGEDVNFCADVRRLLGSKAVLLDTDPRIESAHIGSMRATRREYQAAHFAAARAAQVGELKLAAGYEVRLERTGNRAQRRAAGSN